ALPLVALGGVGHLIFSRYETIKKLFLILFGFGLLFLGLDFMNASVESFARSFDFQQFRDYGLFFFFLLGIFLSALMQSSSLANALTLSALHAGIISLPIGMAVVLGTNIGTTSTAILASLGGKSGKRQVAATHLFFNLYSSFIGFIFFTPFLIFITEVLGYRDDPVTGLALYNILFNIVTGVLALPFVNWITEYIQRVFSTKKEKLDLAIDGLGSDLDEEILGALQKDVRFLLSKVISFNLALFSLSNRNGKIISQNGNFSFSHMMEEYFLLKKIQQRLVAFTMERQLLSKDQDFLEHYRQIVSQINVILYSAKIFKDIYHNLLDLQESDSIILKKMLAVVRKNVSTYYKILQSFIEKKSKLDYAFELKNLLSAMKFSDLFFYRYGKEKNFFQNLEEADFSTILMINRAIYSSSKSLFQGVKNLMLTKEQLEVLRNSK
ncbi:MAG TPA: Na/Pi symporter, partial [Candidatus Absconditabacterales bacterium]|nr:Na/Pi symporter [Candidatus Absconditabacterales bacterium]